jgi:hypothetical protein
MTDFNGLGMSLGTLARLSNARTRSISPENFSGEPGAGGMAEDGTGAQAARDLGRGWKLSPSIKIQPGETRVLADVRDQGAIQQIWMTPTGHWRHSILRIYWDDQEQPAVECPVGDFFACGWQQYAQVSSLAVCVNPGSAFNCYWEMPFRSGFKITMTNIAAQEMTLYYQINYTLTDVPEDAAYFHAQFRRTNPLPYKDVYTILDGVQGRGQYVGTYMAWGVNNSGWWGEGEIKFYMDGDRAWPTICGTSAARTTSTSAPSTAATASSRRPTPASRRCCGPTEPIARRRVSACTAGTSWTRSASRASCASRSRRSAGVPAGATCRCRTTSPR